MHNGLIVYLELDQEIYFHVDLALFHDFDHDPDSKLKFDFHVYLEITVTLSAVGLGSLN